MPRSAVVTMLVIMWIAITASVVTVNLGAEPRRLSKVPIRSGERRFY